MPKREEEAPCQSIRRTVRFRVRQRAVRLRGGRGNAHLHARPVFAARAGAATVKRECDRVGASERSAARLSHTQSVSIARTPKRFEAQER
jgi:hypothetical protein